MFNALHNLRCTLGCGMLSPTSHFLTVPDGTPVNLAITFADCSFSLSTCATDGIFITCSPFYNSIRTHSVYRFLMGRGCRG